MNARLETDLLRPVSPMAWTARPDMSCESLSRPWLEFTGYTAEQALGNGWSYGVHPEDLARWLETFIRAFDTREPFEIEYRLRRRDGEYRWVLDRGVPRFGAGGGFMGYSGLCVDIEASLPKDLQSRVLLVHDDSAARESTARTLGIAGAQTRSAASADQALATLGCWLPDVLLIDLCMRSDAGFALIRAVRSLPPELGGSVRAVALGPRCELEGSLPARSAGFDAVLAKPVGPRALLAAIARLTVVIEAPE